MENLDLFYEIPEFDQIIYFHYLEYNTIKKKKEVFLWQIKKSSMA
jgi:hypothetical protein